MMNVRKLFVSNMSVRMLFTFRLFKAVRMVTFDIPSMRSCRVQLQLGDDSNGELIIYQRSTVVSDLLIDGKFCYLKEWFIMWVLLVDSTFSEEDNSLSSSIKNSLIADSTDQSSLYTKRLFEKLQT
jgi:hypothetical protein